MKVIQQVVCKFFEYSKCAAGKLCPFSHSLTRTENRSICTYFAWYKYGPPSKVIDNTVLHTPTLTSGSQGENIPPNVKWTQIPRLLISTEVLDQDKR